MITSRFFRAPQNPGRIPVTDACVAPSKEGMGILIRRIVRKRPRHTTQSSGRRSRRGGDGHARDPNNECESSINNNESNVDGDIDEHETMHFYLPRPGDVCVIRYDCYRLSPLAMDRDRHGRQRISEAQQFQNRKRSWVDGNFDGSPLSTTPPISNTNDKDNDDDNENNHGQPYTHNDPYCDGENNKTRCPLRLPSLEFEIGTGDVIRGLEVVVQRMVEGEIVEATIPHLYGYGYKGLYPRIPPKADLVFVVKLEKVIPSASNAAAAAAAFLSLEGNGEPNHSYIYGNFLRRTTSNIHQDLAVFCCGLAEATFVVMFGIAIPILLLLRSELDMEEIFRFA